jgi:hypothetical protein
VQVANDEAVFLATWPGENINVTALTPDGALAWGSSSSMYEHLQPIQTLRLVNGGSILLATCSVGT